MKKTVYWVVALFLLLCGCSSKSAGTEVRAGSFSYADDCAYYEAETVGVKRSEFINTEKAKIENAEQAVGLAKNECTVDYDTVAVDYDTNAKIYRVSFYKADEIGENQDVYLNQDGITQLIVFGE